MARDKLLKLVQDCLDNKEKILDLGNYGLSDHDFNIISELGSLLKQCTHLETLILSNSWNDWNENSEVDFSDDWTNDPTKFTSIIVQKPTLNYYTVPDYRPSKKNEAAYNRKNKISKIPEAILYLVNLSTLVCGGDETEVWKISDVSLLKKLKNLKTLILDYNRIYEVDFFESLPRLEKLSLIGNRISYLEDITVNKQIQFLDLSSNQIQFLLPIEKFPNLRWLNVSNNKVVSARGVEQLWFLKYLNLSHNLINEILPLNNQVYLKELYLSHNYIVHLTGFDRLYKLEHLDISFNRIYCIKGFQETLNLKYLDISANRIRVMQNLEQLTNLTLLNISSNMIMQLQCLQNLLKLKFLDVSCNNIRSVNKDQVPGSIERLILNSNMISNIGFISHLSQLKELCIAGNFIQHLVEAVSHDDLIIVTSVFPKLQQLYYLDISDNRIRNLSGLKVVTGLTVLMAYRNFIVDISDLAFLICLTKVDISINGINDVTIFKNISSVRNLYLARNQIEEIDQLNDLVNLQILDLSNNKIKKIEGLEGMPALQRLNLSLNFLHDLDNIDKLFKATFTDISGNPISNIKGLILFISKNRNLSFDVDRISFKGSIIIIKQIPYLEIPVEIQQRGTATILNWFIARGQGGLININAKCILFGNGEAGKTALSYYLRKKKFLDRNDRTHGIIIEKWTIPISNLSVDLQGRIYQAYKNYRRLNDIQMPTSCTLFLWDFGGQEYYHATHRLFMSTNILYLLLWQKDSNNQDDEKGNYPLNYWVKNIQYYSPDNITLVIENKTQKEYSGVDNYSTFKIQEYKKGDKKSIAQYKLDIDNLKQGILDQFGNLPHIGIFIPKVYDDIKLKLQKLKTFYVTYAQYQEICRLADNTELGIMEDDSQTETLLRYLDDIGSLVCFRFRKEIQAEILKEYVFTDPVWLTKVIYEILEKEKDEFDEPHVASIVSKYGLSTTLWIEIMKQFELIFEIETVDGKRYVAPQYLPVKCKNPVAYDLALRDKVMDHSFTLNYPDFLPKSNFLRLIARFGDKNINQVYSKDSVVFFYQGATVLGQCISTEQERKIKIFIQDKNKKAAKDIFDALIDIDPHKDLEISLDEKNYVLEKRIRSKLANKNFEVDSNAGKTLRTEDFRFLYEEQHSIDSILQDMTAAKPIKIFISYSSKDNDLQRLITRGLSAHLSNRKGYSFSFWTDKAIDIGGDWKKSIEENLRSSNAAILLVSATFASSEFVNKVELAEFFRRKQQENYPVMPVLVRNYDFSEFEQLSSLQFFKTYYREYGFNLPINRDEFLPFDVLAENENTTDKQLQDYYKKLADEIYSAVKNQFEQE